MQGRISIFGTETLSWGKFASELCRRQSAIEAIEMHHPDIVFLDIEMPGISGFDMLEPCRFTNFEVIFTTAYNEYAIKAIRHNALDYIFKAN